MNDFWSYWYFHVPNFVLAAVLYTLLGRLVLGLVAPDNWDNYIWRAFKAITDPVLGLVRLVTPNVLGSPIVTVFSVLWIMVIRILYFGALMSAGLAPSAQGS
jgi:uncharacterized protein YggT (Ycf19 family)